MTSHDPVLDTSVPLNPIPAGTAGRRGNDRDPTQNLVEQNLVDTAKGHAEDAGRTVLAAVGAVAHNVTATAEQARDTVSHAAHQAREGLATFSEDLEASIERNPLTAVLIALGVGVAVGLLGSARR